MKEIVTEIIMRDALRDSSEGVPKKVTVAMDRDRILIRPAGYGDLFSIDGEGWPILFEIAEGRPRLVIWGDINQEEPTHIFELKDSAKESNRRKDEI